MEKKQNRKMKNFRHLSTTLLLLCCSVTFAEVATVDGINYDVITKAKTAIVTGGARGTDRIAIPETIEYNGITYSVKSIGEQAFENSTSLTSITIPGSITDIGKSAFKGCSALAEVHIKDIAAWCRIKFKDAYSTPLCYAKRLYIENALITDLVIPDGITEINDLAFRHCSSLTSVTIPEETTKIGEYSFSYCTSLKEVKIPNTVTDIGYGAFYGCSSLRSARIPNGIAEIGNSTFSGCASLTEITLPGSVTKIGNSTFSGCTSLTEITFPGSITKIGNSAFEGCASLTEITLPSSVTNIGEYAFHRCSGLKRITVGNKITDIGRGAFFRCHELEEVYINDLSAWCNINFTDDYEIDPDGTTYHYKSTPMYYAAKLYLNGELLTDIVIPNDITAIKDYTFYGCSSIENITIPGSVTSIGEEAFYNCTSLTSATIGNGVTTIGNCAFEYCNNLRTITIGNGVTTIGNCAFYRCSNLTDITIPNKVERIGNQTFYACSSLAGIKIGTGVTAIEDGAFENCTSLTNIEIPDNVTTIHKSAFAGCSALTSATIGRGTKSIYSMAFAKCTNLTDVYCLATEAPSASSETFNKSYPEYMTLHVPAESIDKYKARAPWSSFGNIVTLDGKTPETPEAPETKSCTTPVISYSNGKLSFYCETENAEFISEILCRDAGKHYTGSVDIAIAYDISVYATATGYENSESANATLLWIEDENNENDNGIVSTPATAALITSAKGTVTVSSTLNGETVSVYTTAGTLIGSAIIADNTATIATGLSKGAIAIVKIDEKSIKIVL